MSKILKNSQVPNKVFRAKCQKVSDQTGVAVDFFREEPYPYREPLEDDGTLHIHSKNGDWACFDIGQDLPRADQNRRIRAVMDGMKLKVTDSVLVRWDDDEEDEGCCTKCGR